MKVTEKKFLNLHQTLSPISTANGKHGGHNNNNNNTLGSAADQLTVAVSVPPVNSDSLTAAVNCQPVPVTVSDVITTTALTTPVTNGLHNGLVTGAEDPNDKVRT